MIHTSQKSSPSSPPLMNLEKSPPQVSQKYNQQLILTRLVPIDMQRTHMTASNQSQMTMKTNLPRSKNFLNATCPGSQNIMNQPLIIATPVAKKPVGYSEPTTKTFLNPNSLSKLPQTHQLESPLHNGNISSEEMQLTSTKFLHPYTMLSLMKREQVAWETQKSCLEFLKAKNESPLLQNGHQHGEELQELLVSPSHIGKKNFSNMGTTSKVNLWPNSPLPITRSFSTTSPSETKLLVANIPYSPIFKNSPDFTPPSCSLMALNLHQGKQTLRNQLSTRVTTNPRYVTSSTLEHARTQKPTASTDISARTVTSLVIPKRIAYLIFHEIHGLKPKYLHHNLWRDTLSLSPTTAEWSETAWPLSRPPFKEISNLIALKTITDNLFLFQVKTPINVETFQSLLENHPNPDFINLVCMGLHEGFWPWADTLHDGFPITHDKS